MSRASGHCFYQRPGKFSQLPFAGGFRYDAHVTGLVHYERRGGRGIFPLVSPSRHAALFMKPSTQADR